MAKYIIPTKEELLELAESSRSAQRQVTVYYNIEGNLNSQEIVHQLRTSLSQGGASEEQLNAFDESTRDFSPAGANTAAVFLADDILRFYALPNRLVADLEVYSRINLKQIFRSISFSNRALLLCLDAGGSKLFEATQHESVKPVPVDWSGIENVTEANNRESVRDKDHRKKLGGEERYDVFYDRYAKRIAERIERYYSHELPRDTTLIVTGNLELVQRYFHHSRFLAQDRIELKGEGLLKESLEEMESCIRLILEGRNKEASARDVDRLLSLMSSGKVLIDYSDIGRAIFEDRAAELVFDFNTPVSGSYDPTTGEIDYSAPGDLLNELSVAALLKGAEVRGYRWSDVREEQRVETSAILRTRY